MVSPSRPAVRGLGFGLKSSKATRSSSGFGIGAIIVGTTRKIALLLSSSSHQHQGRHGRRIGLVVVAAVAFVVYSVSSSSVSLLGRERESELGSELKSKLGAVESKMSSSGTSLGALESESESEPESEPDLDDGKDGKDGKDGHDGHDGNDKIMTMEEEEEYLSSQHAKLCPQSNDNGNGSNNPYSLAKEQSFGFFNDISCESWNRLRQITSRVSQHTHSYPNNPLYRSHIPHSFYQMNYEPNFSCLFEKRVGGNGNGDGPKWICDPHRLIEISRDRKRNSKGVEHKERQQEQNRDGDDDDNGDNHGDGNGNNDIPPGCVIYSIGSNGDFQFETGIQNLLGPDTCEIHIFDMGDYEHLMPKDLNLYYHHWGITSSENVGGADGGNSGSDGSDIDNDIDIDDDSINMDDMKNDNDDKDNNNDDTTTKKNTIRTKAKSKARQKQKQHKGKVKKPTQAFYEGSLLKKLSRWFGFRQETFKSFEETVKILGHDNLPAIDILKIDCEGCEWDVYQDWFGRSNSNSKSNGGSNSDSNNDTSSDTNNDGGNVNIPRIGQVLVEVHRSPSDKVIDFFDAMYREGYVTFHKEFNTQYARGNCVEYAFLKLDKEYFNY